MMQPKVRAQFLISLLILVRIDQVTGRLGDNFVGSTDEDEDPFGAEGDPYADVVLEADEGLGVDTDVIHHASTSLTRRLAQLEGICDDGSVVAVNI